MTASLADKDTAPRRKRDGLHVLYVHPNSEVGGSDIALARTIEAMHATGQQSTVVLPHDGPMVARLRNAGATVHFLPMQQLRTLPSARYQAGYIFRFVPTVLRLAAFIRRVRPDLVHSNSMFCLYGAFAAKLTRTPHLWHIREMAPSIPVLTNLFARMVKLLSTTILAMSDSCLDQLYRRWPRQAVVMPDALDADEFRKPLQSGRLRRELAIPADTPIVGFAARLDPWKGCHVFLDACAIVRKSHPNAKFLISGGSPQGLEQYGEDLKRQAAALRLEDSVEFLGWRYRMQEMVDVMDGIDIFCHTSTTAEPFGLVLLEAMSVATPVISVRAGGPLTIIEDGISGILVEPGDQQALAEAISSLLDDPGRAARIGLAGQTRQEAEFSIPKFVDNLSGMYARTIDAS